MDRHPGNDYEEGRRMSPHSLLQNLTEVEGCMGFSAAHLAASTGGKWVEMGRSLWSKDKSEGPHGKGLQVLGGERSPDVC